MARYIVLTGTVIDGLGLHGPFATFEHAHAFAQHFFFTDNCWVVGELWNPNSLDDENDWSGLNLPPVEEETDK